MSLVIWLPLTGHLNNQGTSSVSMSNLNATISSDGKLGQCYSFNGNSSRIYNDNVSISNNEMSGACWVKLTSVSNRSYLFSLGGNSQIYGKQQQIGIWMETDGHPYVCAMGSELDSGYALAIGAWYHVCMTYSGSTSKLYINGTLVFTGTNANTKQTRNKFCVGARSNTDTGASAGISLPLNGKLNDVRIYDHCLSPKEVSEISKGLILHYPLDGYRFGANIASGTNTASVSTNKLYFSEQTGGSTRTIEYSDGIPCIKITRNSTTHSGWSMLYYNGWNRSMLKTSTTYTLSMDVIASGSGTISFGGFKNTNSTKSLTSSITTIQNSFNSDSWSHIVIRTTTISSFTDVMDNQVIYMSCGYLTNTDAWILVKNFKLEEGNNDTPWMPYVSDSAYTNMGYNETTEYDASGYLHNALRNGTFTWSQSTPRYTLSTICSGSNYLEADPLPNETLSVSFWIKTTWTTTSVYQIVFHDQTTGLAAGWSGTRLITYIGSSNGGAGSQVDTNGKLIANQWNHFVIVKTASTKRTVYINGEVVAPTSSGNYWGGDLYKLNIGVRHISNAYNHYFNGQVSDFRAYATALTANDVTDLYRNCISVSNRGIIYSSTLNES